MKIDPIVKEYRRTTHDPLLEQVLDHLHGKSAADIARKTGISTSTLRAWRSGKTRRPQSVTMSFALRAVGMRLGIVEK